MPSSDDTLRKAQRANQLFSEGKSIEEIAKELRTSKSRVSEYLEVNEHGSKCDCCHGKGVNWNSKTHTKTPICKKKS
jgi:predicted transcriptional regulator